MKQRLIRSTLWLPLLGLSFISLITFWPDLHWRVEQLSHLRPFFAYGALFFLFLTGWLRQKVGLLLAMLTLLLNLSPLLPLWLPAADGPVAATPFLNVVHLNVDRQRGREADALDLLLAQEADLLLLQEITPQNLPIFTDGLTGYELIIAEPRDNTQGSAVFATPDLAAAVRNTHTLYWPAYSTRPLLAVDFSWHGHPYTVLSLHTTRPNHPQTSAFQALEFEAVAAWALEQQAAGRSLLIIGDFNTTPWSARFQQLLHDGALHNSQSGYGYQPTWPRQLPPFLRLPIDHAVVSPQLIVTQRAVHSTPASDHLLLHIELNLNPLSPITYHPPPITHHLLPSPFPLSPIPCPPPKCKLPPQKFYNFTTTS